MLLLLTNLPRSVFLRFTPAESVPSHSLWIDTDIAKEQWEWLREHADRPITQGLDWNKWLLGFLGSRDLNVPATHVTTLRIMQGIDTAQVPGSRQHMLPGVDPTDALKLARAVREAAAATNDLSSVPMTAALRWVRDHPEGVSHTTALAAGWEILNQDTSLASGLTSMLDGSRPDQYFATVAPRIWSDGVRQFPWLLMTCGIGSQSEGTVVPHFVDCMEALGSAKASGWSLRSFLGHAYNQGRAGGIRSQEEAAESHCDDEQRSRETMSTMSEFFQQSVGPLNRQIEADHLLRCMDMSLRQYQRSMFDALDAGAVSILAFLSYDYCWWRGAMEGMKMSRVG